MWCPGCNDAHRVTFGSPDAWTWDGNEAAPTIAPSILTTGVQWAHDGKFYRPGHVTVPTGGQTVCHSFVRAGQWEFLSDCTHTLAGQTVPMVPLPDWLTDEYVGPPEPEGEQQ
jgi:hypothetical protein